MFFIVFEELERGEMLGGVSLLDTPCKVAETVLKQSIFTGIIFA